MGLGVLPGVRTQLQDGEWIRSLLRRAGKGPSARPDREFPRSGDAEVLVPIILLRHPCRFVKGVLLYRGSYSSHSLHCLFRFLLTKSTCSTIIVQWRRRIREYRRESIRTAFRFVVIVAFRLLSKGVEKKRQQKFNRNSNIISKYRHQKDKLYKEVVLAGMRSPIGRNCRGR